MIMDIIKLHIIGTDKDLNIHPDSTVDIQEENPLESDKPAFSMSAW